jgi:hypothetical protein
MGNLFVYDPGTGLVTFHASALLAPCVQVLGAAVAAGLLVFIFWFGLRIIFRCLKALAFYRSTARFL